MPDSAIDRPRKRITIRVTVVGIFLVATLLTAALAVGLHYYFTRALASEAAVNRFEELAASSRQYLNAIDSQAQQVTRVLASYPTLIDGQWINGDVREFFAAMMRDNNAFYAIYVGFDNGDLYEVVNLNSGVAVRQQLQAQPSDRWVVITITDGSQGRQRSYEYYSEDFSLRSRRSERSQYNAADRPWFVHAVTGEVKKTTPYLLHNLQAPGQTYSSRVPGGAVVAVDIALSSLSELLAKRTPEKYGDIFLFRAGGELVASNLQQPEASSISPASPLSMTDEDKSIVAAQAVLRVSNQQDWAPIDFSLSGQPQGYSVDYLNLISEMTGIEMEFINGFSWPELVKLFRSGDIDILQPVVDVSGLGDVGVSTEAFLQLPYALVTRPGNDKITHIQQLNGKTLAIPKGWTIVKVLEQELPGIQLLLVDSGQQVLKAVSDGKAYAGIDFGEVLHYTADRFFYEHLQFHDSIEFSPIHFPDGLHLVLNTRHSELLPILNAAIANVQDQHKQQLAKRWLYGPNQFRGLLAVPHQQLLDLVDKPALQQQLLEAQIDGIPQYIFVSPFGSGLSSDYLGIVIPIATVVAPALEKLRLTMLLTGAFLLLLLPAPWLFASPIVGPIKKLALENEKIRRRAYDELDIPGSYIREIDGLGLSMTAMVNAIRQHEREREELMDAFIELIAQAIDDKSHYTAGHCERVPELAIMLAEQAERSDMPAFRQFSFRNDDERREFHIGAWLHDCGKITTPEHIVDKGSKLEAIYNRIHEVRTRFEVLWRDAEIHYWQQLAENPSEAEHYQEQRDATQARLKDDFAFVAAMNVGGEFLSDEKLERLRKIAGQTWIRNFSDRIGLSPVEELRIDGEEPPLPVTETLLADKPHHIVPREHDTDYDPRLGIKVDVPEYLYNLGELYNLSIQRGTLTTEDRFKINEHIISTIRMLDALPFPDELARVPQYASTHHETLKGTGYPRRLTGDQLSIPERIMVLADIFEALTAADRPYKKAKPVSVAIDILSKMVDDQHVDVDVFELFLTSGVYRRYADQYLTPEQLDIDDISRFLRE